MDCPICYQSISVDDEAYVASCYHRFCHKCISAWTAQQRKHPIPDITGTGTGGSRPDYRCPMCKQPYEYILYECVLNSFRIEFVDEEAQRRGRATVGSGTRMPLSAAHRRRRALYVKQLPQLQEQQQQPQGEKLKGAHASTGPWQGQLQDGSIASSGMQGRGRPSSAPGVAEGNRWQASAATAATVSALQPAPRRTAGVGVAAAAAARVRRPDDPEVRVFVERELQAVLLQEDVGMLLQHVLGLLKNVLGGGGGGSSCSASGSGGSSGGVSRLSVPAIRSSRCGARQQGRRIPFRRHRPEVPSSAPSEEDAKYAPPSAKRARTAMAPSLPQRQEFENVLSREMASFLVEQDSLTFVGQLYLFLASGLSVRGYDELVFGPDEATRGATAKVAAAEGKYSGAGTDRQESSEVVDLADDEEYDELDINFDSG